MTYGNNPPGGYEDPPPGGYGGRPPGEYGNPPPAGPPGGYAAPPPAGPPGGYGAPPPGGYSGPPPGEYGNPPPAGPPGGYGAPPPGGYAGQPGPGGYANPAGGYANPGGGYGSPQGYGPPGPAGFAASPSDYANWLQRVGAYLIDVIPVLVLEGIGLATRSTTIYLLFILLAIGVTAYNRWFQAGKTGQSWGKRALGLSLIGEQTGQPIGAGMAFVRDICHIIDGIICYIGFLFPLWDAKRQTLADKIMRTVVIPAA